MDGGSGLNILYANTMELLELDQSCLRGGATPFHGIMPRKRARPLERIDLPVCFGTPSNYRKEILTFDVVGFKGTYHAILGWPCYAKFMAIPNYTYLKLKMPGPNDIITVSSAFSHAFTCDHEHFELATVVVNSSELPQLRESSI